MAERLTTHVETEPARLWREYCEAVEDLRRTCREFADDKGSLHMLHADAGKALKLFEAWRATQPPDDLPF